MRISTTPTVGPSALKRVQQLKDSSQDQHAGRGQQDLESSEDVVEIEVEKVDSGKPANADGLPHIDTEA